MDAMNNPRKSIFGDKVNIMRVIQAHEEKKPFIDGGDHEILASK